MAHPAFVRAFDSILARLGQDAVFRSGIPTRVHLATDIEVTGEHGVLVLEREVVSMWAHLSPRAGDALRVGDVNYVIDEPPFDNNGVRVKAILRRFGTVVAAPDVTDITVSGSLVVGAAITFGATNVGGAVASHAWVFRVDGVQVATSAVAAPSITFAGPGVLVAAVTASNLAGSDVHGETVGTLTSASAFRVVTESGDFIATGTGDRIAHQ